MREITQFSKTEFENWVKNGAVAGTSVKEAAMAQYLEDEDTNEVISKGGFKNIRTIRVMADDKGNIKLAFVTLFDPRDLLKNGLLKMPEQKTVPAKDNPARVEVVEKKGCSREGSQVG